MSSDECTRAYIAQKRTKGKSPKKATQCLKRATCRETHRLLTNPPEVPRIDDLRPLRLPQLSRPVGSILTLERGVLRTDDLATAYRQWPTNA